MIFLLSNYLQTDWKWAWRNESRASEEAETEPLLKQRQSTLRVGGASDRWLAGQCFFGLRVSLVAGKLEDKNNSDKYRINFHFETGRKGRWIYHMLSYHIWVSDRLSRNFLLFML